MNKEKLLEIVNDVENKSNSDLMKVLSELSEEFEKTKELIINLTRHMDYVEDLYNKVNKELGKRNKPLV
jgi:uncharacterized membrane protein YgaE (UPF0421/DUF939 family)